MYRDAHVVDLLSEEKYQRLLVRPGLFADEMRALQPGSWVVVDEIQRLPQLLNEVHRFVLSPSGLCGEAAGARAQAPQMVLVRRQGRS
jgi:hypothetical protein